MSVYLLAYLSNDLVASHKTSDGGMKYEISITRLDGCEQSIGRTYGEEFFKLSNDDIALNILGMFEAIREDNTEEVLDEMPDEGSPDHPLALSEEEWNEKKREPGSNLA